MVKSNIMWNIVFLATREVIDYYNLAICQQSAYQMAADKTCTAGHQNRLQ
jgi:hypothetical protein